MQWRAIPLNRRKPLEKFLIGAAVSAASSLLVYLAAASESASTRGIMIALLTGIALAIKNAATPREKSNNATDGDK